MRFSFPTPTTILIGTLFLGTTLGLGGYFTQFSYSKANLEEVTTMREVSEIQKEGKAPITTPLTALEQPTFQVKEVTELAPVKSTPKTNAIPRKKGSTQGQKETLSEKKATTPTQKISTPTPLSVETPQNIVVPTTSVTRTVTDKDFFSLNAEEIPTLAAYLDNRIRYIKIEGKEKVTEAQIQEKKALLGKVLQIFPETHTSSLAYLTINMNEKGPRGLGGANTIIVRAGGLSNEEFASVFLHELGHIIDLGYLGGTPGTDTTEFEDNGMPVYANDPSVVFYRLSWSAERTRHTESTALDFVSGYSASDNFEDFAETLTYYVFHGKEFRTLAEKNAVLKGKYTFLKDTVFAGKEFETGREKVKGESRDWDTTVLPKVVAHTL